MGLTIHYDLQAPDNTTPEQARELVEKLRQKSLDLPFAEVSDLYALSGKQADFNTYPRGEGGDETLRWLLIQATERAKVGEGVTRMLPPTHLFAFSTWPGEGCEAANFGLCLYPKSVTNEGKRYRTKLKGWGWGSFCKTQYASDPACGGVEHFIKCHLLVIRMCDIAKELGILENVSDEGGYYTKRDVEALAKEVGEWNGMIGAFAGTLQQIFGDRVVSAIDKYPNAAELKASGKSK